MEQILESEIQILEQLAPILERKVSSSLYFPALEYQEEEELNDETIATINQADYFEIPEATNLGFPRFEHLTESILCLRKTDVCPICGAGIPEGIVCVACGTVIDRKKLMFRLGQKPFFEGNEQKQAENEWKQISIHKLLKEIRNKTSSCIDLEDGLMIRWGGESHLLQLLERWALSKNGVWLRIAESDLVIIQQLWRIWRKQIFDDR